MSSIIFNLQNVCMEPEYGVGPIILLGTGGVVHTYIGTILH